MNSPITPVAVFPTTASTLYISDAWFFPAQGFPTFNWFLQDSGGNNLLGGQSPMTDDQWDAWSTSTEDSAYILACVAANLGLTLT